MYQLNLNVNLNRLLNLNRLVKPKGGIADKAAKKSLLRKYGVPASIIAGVLTGSTLLNKKDKKPAAKKEAKKETANEKKV